MIDTLNSPHEYRGYLIDAVTKLERAIESYIINYFLPNNNDKRFEMREILLDRLTFDAKITSLQTILNKKAINSGFKKTNSKGYPYNKLIKEINDVRKIRNYFAHYYLSYSNNETVIALIENRDSTKVITYTHDQFESIIKRIESATMSINQI